MYKIEYETLAIMPDGRLGNIVRDRLIAYTGREINEIEDKLNEYLIPKKEKAVIIKIEKIRGHVI